MTTSLIAGCGSGRSTSVMPAVPAARSVTVIAFTVRLLCRLACAAARTEGGTSRTLRSFSCLSGFAETVKCRSLRRQPDVRVVLQHPAPQVSGNRLNDMVRLSRFKQPRHHRVPQVVEPQPAQP